MKLALLAIWLAIPAAAQVEIHYSRQSDAVVKALVGTVPKDVSLYRADVRNLGTEEARLFPDRVGFEASAVAPHQDPEAAIFAAKEYKNTRWWVVALKAGATLAPYGGAALLGLQAFGVKIPDSANTITAGFNGGAALFGTLHKEATNLTVPTTWLQDNMPEIILRPGQGAAYLIALGGKPPETFGASISVSKESLLTGHHPSTTVDLSEINELTRRLGQNTGIWAPPVDASTQVTFTRPMVDQVPDEDQYLVTLERMIRENTARNGANK